MPGETIENYWTENHPDHQPPHTPHPTPTQILIYRNSSNTPLLHIPKNKHEPLCESQGRKPDTKSIDCYPPAWRTWCQKCVKKHRQRGDA